LFITVYRCNLAVKRETKTSQNRKEMKTKLPESITTIEEAKLLLRDLHSNGESFHPEDSAHDIIWSTAEPTEEEKDQLDKLMSEIYNLPEVPDSFDPCGFLIDLDSDGSEKKLRESEFTIDYEKYYKGFTLGDTWNGFFCPYFTLETAKEIIKDITDENGFLEGSDEKVSLADFPMVTIENKELYPVGAFAWVWEEKEAAE
jgi:hypothetical protein